MLRIQVLDKERFLHQVAQSRGNVYLHFKDGSVCDIKHDRSAANILQMMDFAPTDGISISVEDPADVTGFLHYMLEAGRSTRTAC